MMYTYPFVFVRRDRHGSLRRRVFSRHRGLSPSELDCLETVEYYSAVGAGVGVGVGVGVAAAADDTALESVILGGDDSSSYTEDGDGDGNGSGGGGGGIELLEENHACSSSGTGARVGDREEGGVEAVEDGDDEASRGAAGAGGETTAASDCAICLSGFKNGDLLRKLPW